MAFFIRQEFTDREGDFCKPVQGDIHVVQAPELGMDNFTGNVAADNGRSGTAGHIHADSVKPELVKIPAHVMLTQRLLGFFLPVVDKGSSIHAFRQGFTK